MKPIFDLDNRDPNELINKFNNLQCFKGSGAIITKISDNLDMVHLEIPLNENTSNFIGTVYGGSMYAATDAVYMVMLWYALGKEYLLIDRSSKVNYLRPGTTKLTAEFNITNAQIVDIVDELKEKKSTSREFVIKIIDENKKVVCKISKDIYIRK